LDKLAACCTEFANSIIPVLPHARILCIEEVDMAQEDEKKVDDQEETPEKEAEEQPWMELPPVNFENFVLGLRNTALIHLGFRDPETGKLIQNLPLARHTIDTLGMIEGKTRGNLTAPEANLLENILYELRMSYLRAGNLAKEEAGKEEAETTQSEEEPEAEGEAVQETDKQEALDNEQ
jgi:hypothetical protein